MKELQFSDVRSELKNANTTTIRLTVAVVLAGTLQATAIMFGAKGVPVYLISLTLFVLYYICHYRLKKATIRYIIASVCLGLIFVFQSKLAIIFFPDIQILDPNSGIDSQVVRGGSQLEMGLSQIVQPVFFIINSFLLILFCDLARKKFFLDLKKIFNLSFIFVIMIGYFEYLSKSTGLGLFPHSIIHSNTGYALNYDVLIDGKPRFVSAFAEASLAGAYIASFLWFFLLTEKNKRILWIFAPLGILGLVLTYSATGYAAFLLGCLLYLLYKTPRLIKPLVIIGIALATIFLYEPLKNAAFEKIGSQSGVSRLSSDLFSAHVFLNTYGHGSGLGSHRSSGFIANLLANIGILSILIFYLVVRPLIKLKLINPFCFLLVIYFFSMSIGIPDLNNPIFFIVLGAAWYEMLMAIKAKNKMGSN